MLKKPQIDFTSEYFAGVISQRKVIWEKFRRFDYEHNGDHEFDRDKNEVAQLNGNGRTVNFTV